MKFRFFVSFFILVGIGSIFLSQIAHSESRNLLFRDSLYATKNCGLDIQQCISFPDRAEIVRERTAFLDTNFIPFIISNSLPADSKTVIQFFSDAQVNVVWTKKIQLDTERIALYGFVSDDNLNSFVFIVNTSGGYISGDIKDHNNRMYRIRPTSGSQHFITELKHSNIRDFHLDPEMIKEGMIFSHESEENSVEKKELSHVEPKLKLDDGSVVDILVAYSALTDMKYIDIKSEIALAVENMNLTFENSNIDTKLRLVGLDKVYYDETDPNTCDISTILFALISGKSGLESVHEKRDEYGADLVSFFIDSTCTEGIAGVAFSYFLEESLAFNVLVAKWANYPDVGAFTHETGHLFGAGHDREAPGSSGAHFDYSFGYLPPDKSFRTAMAYGSSCDWSCPLLKYFSNPDLQYQGQALGIPEGLIDPHGNNIAADNSRTLQETRILVSNYRRTNQNDSYDTGWSISDIIYDFRNWSLFRKP
ncbi:hypothetical protein HYV57_05350 [Candidatus Peregrinibacteria bacterium]|nr:hypothetical protein [Candidatus Peregrinibacteria bacterium]